MSWYAFAVALVAAPLVSFASSPDTAAALIAVVGEQPRTIAPFTGQVTRPRVRMRLHPDLSGKILRELEQGDMLIVLGEADDFYAVEPPEGVRGYIHRRYVIDGVVEGDRVNVRLQPSLDAPVVAQLDTGTLAEGGVSEENSKWIEVELPKNVRFFVAKEYVEQVGDQSYLSRTRARSSEAANLVNAAYVQCQKELQKPYEEMDLETACTELSRVSEDYPEQTEEVARAEYLLSMVKESYLKKRVDHLEQRAATAASSWEGQCRDLARRMQQAEEDLGQLDGEIPEGIKMRVVARDSLDQEQAVRTVTVRPGGRPALMAEPQRSRGGGSGSAIHPSMRPWVAREGQIFQQWSMQYPHRTIDDFYVAQAQNASRLSGMLMPSTRPTRNRPGSHVLLNPRTQRPIAYLYSTKVDLREHEGEIVEVIASPRPNNYFAFPAFFVMNVESFAAR